MLFSLDAWGGSLADSAPGGTLCGRCQAWMTYRVQAACSDIAAELLASPIWLVVVLSPVCRDTRTFHPVEVWAPRLDSNPHPQEITGLPAQHEAVTHGGRGRWLPRLIGCLSTEAPKWHNTRAWTVCIGPEAG